MLSVDVVSIPFRNGRVCHGPRYAMRLDIQFPDRAKDKWNEDAIAVENEILGRGDLKPFGGVCNAGRRLSITCCFPSWMSNDEEQERIALRQTDKLYVTGAHLTAIFSLESRIANLPVANDTISSWLGACRHELENRTAKVPHKPTDSQRADKLSCACGALSAFLANPEQKQGLYPLAKKRRRHLHQIIDGNSCDLTFVKNAVAALSLWSTTKPQYHPRLGVRYASAICKI